MKIKVITISGNENSPGEKLSDEYIRRVQHYIPAEKISLKTSLKKNISDQKKEDAASVLKQRKENEELILLDESGKEFSSIEFAEFLRKKMNASKNLCFVIGSAYGFDEELKKKSSLMISLSRMTLPHQLAQVIFTEQLYRAFTILRNEKYHRGE
ncbi:MAG: 23S rRNA (pseudouridine(1915)-N(3))-methyltransferase RlmH [Chitinophagales bacterium]